MFPCGNIARCAAMRRARHFIAWQRRRRRRQRRQAACSIHSRMNLKHCRTYTILPHISPNMPKNYYHIHSHPVPILSGDDNNPHSLSLSLALSVRQQCCYRDAITNRKLSSRLLLPLLMHHTCLDNRCRRCRRLSVV